MFSRFNVYAPHVRTLDLSCIDFDDIDRLDLNALVDYCGFRELLPNLQKLKIGYSLDEVLWFDFWVRIFACRSLIDIQDEDEKFWAPCVPIASINTFLLAVVERCPNLKSLPLCLTPTHGAVQTDLWHDLLAEATSLSKVSCSNNLIEAATIQSLSRLPHLTSLEISSNENVIGLLTPLNITLADGAFPSLKTLVLRGFMRVDVNNFWSIPLPFYQLTTVEIEFDSEDENNVIWAIRGFIPVLCGMMPYITCLVLNYDNAAKATAALEKRRLTQSRIFP